MMFVSCLPLPGGIVKKLLDAGFIFAEDLFSADEVYQPEVERILKPYPDLQSVLAECLNPPKKYSVHDLLKIEENCQRILSFSYGLDKLFGGGIPAGSILEVCGAPGSGKTQLCLQLCVSVQLHARLGGLQGEAIYVDTDAGFSPQRITEISQGCRDHCCKVAKVNKFANEIIETLEKQSFTEYYYVSVQDYSQLLATVFTLDDFIEKHKKVKLVVIDSLPFPFLQVTDMMKRTVLLCKILQYLSKLASNHRILVVVTNHLTTRISRGEDQLIPALGECLGCLMNYRLMLGYLPADSHFAGVIFKSPNSLNDSARFLVTPGGIRDI